MRERGTLVRISALNELRALPSYAGDVDMPQPGDLVEQTRSGETYGATILLKNASEAALLADIERCQELNRAGVFDIEPEPERHDELVLVVGCGLRHDREYLLAGVARRARVWLLDAEAPTWQRRYLEGFTQVDPSDERALVAAAEQVAARARPGGLLCYNEQYVEPAARVVEALALPGFSRAAIRNCRDKRRTRDALAAAGVAQPASVAVSSLREARAVAGRIGYPVVLKPRGLAGSMGVILVAADDELAEGFRTAHTPWYPGVPTYEDGVLVEAYLDGPEISIDGALVDGRYVPLFVAHKQLSEHPYFQETGHVIDAADPLLRSPELLGMLAAAHRALGLRRGMTHAEVRLTSAGPRIVEINARLGGDLIPYAGMLATGIDPARVAVDVALGREPEVRRSRSAVAEIRFLYPSEDLVVRAVGVPQPGAIAGLHLAEATAREGAVLRLPPHGYLARYAQLICVAEDRATARAAADRAAAAVRLRFDPAPAFEGDRPDLSWIDAAIPAAA